MSIIIMNCELLFDYIWWTSHFKLWCTEHVWSQLGRRYVRYVREIAYWGPWVTTILFGKLWLRTWGGGRNVERWCGWIWLSRVWDNGKVIHGQTVSIFIWLVNKVNRFCHLDITTHRFDICRLGCRSRNWYSWVGMHEALSLVTCKILSLILSIWACTSGPFKNTIHGNYRSIILILRVHWRIGILDSKGMKEIVSVFIYDTFCVVKSDKYRF